jgi:catechol 2,3-dioxygenase-like lactoylglutathione lyase family enzyme
MTPMLSSVDHLVLTVTDIDQAIRFYCDVLGMTHVPFVVADGSTRSSLQFGHQKINLHLAGHEFKPHAAHPKTGSADLCFLSDTPIDTWIGHLAYHGVDIIEGPVQRTGARFAILSIYVRDPDGALIEISNKVE